MTSGAVNEMMRQTTQAGFVSSTGNAKSAGGNDFSKLMTEVIVNKDIVNTDTFKADAYNTDGFTPQEAKQSGTKEKTEDVNEQKELKDGERVTKAEQSDETTAADKTDEMTVKEEVISQKEEEIKGEIAEKMGISLEELEALMAQLGITLADLTDTSSVVALMSGVIEGTDAIAIMTDENMFEAVNEITKLVNQAFEDLAEELGMTKEELTEYIQDSFAGVIQTETENVLYDDEIKASPTEGFLSGEKEIVWGEASSDDTATTDITSSVSEKNVDHQEAQYGNGNGQMEQQNLAGNVFGEVQFNYTDLTSGVDQTVFSEVSRTQEILDQIAEYVKVNATPEVTEMEIQLNPANLGSVNLQVAAKDGIITAQLIAQNEAVRQALETQSVLIKENLEQQGIKIEAVEVTLAGHAFEENLEQGAGQNETEDSYREDLKRSTRKINLTEMSEEEMEVMTRELSEAEMIQIDMMNRSGNKIDFMV